LLYVAEEDDTDAACAVPRDRRDRRAEVDADGPACAVPANCIRSVKWAEEADVPDGVPGDAADFLVAIAADADTDPTRDGRRCRYSSDAEIPDIIPACSGILIENRVFADADTLDTVRGGNCRRFEGVRFAREVPERVPGRKIVPPLDPDTPDMAATNPRRVTSREDEEDTPVTPARRSDLVAPMAVVADTPDRPEDAETRTGRRRVARDADNPPIFCSYRGARRLKAWPVDPDTPETETTDSGARTVMIAWEMDVLEGCAATGVPVRDAELPRITEANSSSRTTCVAWLALTPEGDAGAMSVYRPTPPDTGNSVTMRRRPAEVFSSPGRIRSSRLRMATGFRPSQARSRSP